MDLVQLITFTLVVLLLVVSPGPNGLLIAKTVPSAGKKAGFVNIAGFIAAFYVHGALSILGISVILTKSAEAFFIFKMLGALYLIWIGVKSLMAAFSKMPEVKVEASEKPQRTLVAAFFEGFLTNVLNPKVSMFYLAAFPKFIPLGDSAMVYAFLLVSVHAAINMAWFSAMVLLFSRFTGAAKSHLFQKRLKGVTGLVFVGFGAKLMTLEAK
jgi:threonine/homoserine/homoserine lactone efflux protein